MLSVSIRHNVEMGHRLSLQPDSKCYHIHGHSWWIEVFISGPPNPTTGMVVNFSDMKQKLRSWLDEYFDHHLLLNENDDLVKLLKYGGIDPSETMVQWGITRMTEPIPHAAADWEAKDPTVENVAMMVYQKAKILWPEAYWRFKVDVQEAHTNHASYGDF